MACKLGPLIVVIALRDRSIFSMSRTPTTPRTSSFPIASQIASATVSTCIGGIDSRLTTDWCIGGNSVDFVAFLFAGESGEAARDRLDSSFAMLCTCNELGMRSCIPLASFRGTAAIIDGGRTSGWYMRPVSISSAAIQYKRLLGILGLMKTGLIDLPGAALSGWEAIADIPASASRLVEMYRAGTNGLKTSSAETYTNG